MAVITVVERPSPFERQVVQFLQRMAEDKRDFALAMLLPSEAGLSYKWNLVLSAPWIDREGSGGTIPAITTWLLKSLSKANAHKLERISVLPTTDPLVSAMANFRIPLGKVSLVQYFPRAEDAIVLVAEPPATSRHYHSQPAQSRA